MPFDDEDSDIAVFDLGGTWFRWGRYASSRGLMDFQRAPAISYLSHPELSVEDLQRALTDFIIRCTREMCAVGRGGPKIASVSVGAPVNAHDNTVLGSGPLWGPSAKPFQLQSRLREVMPEVDWHVVNDITALLAVYMEDGSSFRKTLLLTISTGIGCRLYDHRAHRIPYDSTHGVQGEIGHLVLTFELDGEVIHRQCECGGLDHLNAFCSGRGIAGILGSLPAVSPRLGAAICGDPGSWEQADDSHRLAVFRTLLDERHCIATTLLDALVTPVSRTLTAALTLDPEIDRIVITGGVAHGLGNHYRNSLQRVFRKEGVYQITQRDPQYLTDRLHWEEMDDSGGLRGAGIYAAIHPLARTHLAAQMTARNPR